MRIDNRNDGEPTLLGNDSGKTGKKECGLHFHFDQPIDQASVASVHSITQAFSEDLQDFGIGPCRF
jgi:hypothetical protein